MELAFYYNFVSKVTFIYSRRNSIKCSWITKCTSHLHWIQPIDHLLLQLRYCIAAMLLVAAVGIFSSAFFLPSNRWLLKSTFINDFNKDFFYNVKTQICFYIFIGAKLLYYSYLNDTLYSIVFCICFQWCNIYVGMFGWEQHEMQWL